MARSLAEHPDRVATLKLRGAKEIVVIERGVWTREGELVAVRFTRERRIALGRLKREGGRSRWHPVNPSGSPRDVSPGSVHVLGRVLSVIRPS